MLTNATTLAKKVALRSFMESLRTATVTLADTKKAYYNALEYHKTLTALIDDIHKEGVTLDEDVNDGSNEGAHAFALGVTPPVPPAVTAPRKKSVGKKVRKVNVRELIMDFLTKGNAVLQTKEILTKARETQGKDFPASTVSAALAQLVRDNALHRVRDDKSNTSTYGLPEWFDGDTPKDVHIDGF